MKEILIQILESDQDCPTCLWTPTMGQLSGKIISVTDEIVVLDAVANKRTGKYWTTIIRIDAIEGLEFRSDARPLSFIECEEMGLPLDEEEEEENTNE